MARSPMPRRESSSDARWPRSLPPETAELIGRGIALALDRGELQSAFYQLPMAGRHPSLRSPHRAQRDGHGGRHRARHHGAKHNEEQIRRLAYFDPLTGMPNRLHFLERADRELLRARRANRQLALLFLDLDGFKRINDTLGHSAGDFLLQCVAERLKDKLRAGDIVARPGRDEVARTSPGWAATSSRSCCPTSTTRTVAERGRRARAGGSSTGRSMIGGKAITITASIGIAVFPDDGDDAAALLKHADTAMYHAKDAGPQQLPVVPQDADQQGDGAPEPRERPAPGAGARASSALVYQPQVHARRRHASSASRR